MDSFIDGIRRSPWIIIVTLGVMVLMYAWTGSFNLRANAWSDEERILGALGSGAITLGILLGWQNHVQR